MTTENPASGTTDAIEIENNAQHAKKLFETLDQIHLVAIYPNGLSIIGKDFHTHLDQAIEFCSSMSNAGYNIYWTVNKVRDGLDKKPSKGDIINARFLHIDIDPPKNGAPFNKQEVSDFLMDTECPPSFIVDSGAGIQAFWRLDIPQQNLGPIETVNKQISEYYQADHCWNIDRLMRVPGFRNIPNTAKRKLGRVEVATGWMVEDTGETYEAQEVTNLFPEASNEVGTTSSRIDVELDAIELKTPEDLGLAAGDMAYQAIMQPEGKDRSADGLGACRLLALAGKTDAEIAGILVNKDLPISDHFLSQKYVMRALRRTIGLVRVDTPEISQINIDFDVLLSKIKEENPDSVANKIFPNAPKYTVPQGVPAWQRDISGHPLGLYVEHCEKTALYPQPYIALGSGLACYGALAGRRYSSPTGLRTNIYAIGICESGGGKDVPLRTAPSLMTVAEQKHQVGPARLASGQALLNAVTASPSLLLVFDEFGKTMQSVAGNKAQSYQREIIDNLTQLYSASQGMFLGTDYANRDAKPRVPIEQPCVSMIAVTTPDTLWKSFSSDSVSNGSLARMIAFESENHSTEPNFDVEPTDFPAMLVNNAKEVAEGVNDPFPLGISPEIAPNTHEVGYANEKAYNLWKEMVHKERRMRQDYLGKPEAAFVNRITENAVKIALIHAIAERPREPKLDIHNLEWGMQISMTSLNTMLDASRNRIADNEEEEFKNRLFGVIQKGGKSGASKSELGRKTQMIDARRREAMLGDMEASGRIRSLSETGSKLVTYYALE